MWRNWQDDSGNRPGAGGTCLKSESSGGRGRQMSVSSSYRVSSRMAKSTQKILSRKKKEKRELTLNSRVEKGT